MAGDVSSSLRTTGTPRSPADWEGGVGAEAGLLGSVSAGEEAWASVVGTNSRSGFICSVTRSGGSCGKGVGLIGWREYSVVTGGEGAAGGAQSLSNGCSNGIGGETARCAVSCRVAAGVPKFEGTVAGGAGAVACRSGFGGNGGVVADGSGVDTGCVSGEADAATAGCSGCEPVGDDISGGFSRVTAGGAAAGSDRSACGCSGESPGACSG